MPGSDAARGAAEAALAQLCTFRIGGEDYAIDIMRVREIIHPLPITPVPRAPVFVEGVIRPALRRHRVRASPSCVRRGRSSAHGRSRRRAGATHGA